MIIVVDTNIVFSAIINGRGFIGDILFNSPSHYTFFSPEFMIDEISRYQDKLIKSSKLPLNKFHEAKASVLPQIELISEEVVSLKNWEKAYHLTFEIDQNHTPFVAFALKLDAILWTGDKKLINGMKNLGFDFCKSTDEILFIRNY